MNFLAKTIQLLDDFDIISEDGIVAHEHHEDEKLLKSPEDLKKSGQELMEIPFFIL